MKHDWRKGLAALCVVAWSTLASAQELVGNDETDGWLWLRSAPGTSSLELQRVPNGTVVVQLDRDGRWSFVQLPTGQTGWMYRPFMVEIRRDAGPQRTPVQ